MICRKARHIITVYTVWQSLSVKLGDNCILIFHFLGRLSSERISDDIPPQMKILNTVIPILMHFCSLSSNSSVASRTSSNEVTSSYFRQYIAGYTVANFLTLSNHTSRYKSMCIRIIMVKSQYMDKKVQCFNAEIIYRISMEKYTDT